jgi:hypothetical protein
MKPFLEVREADLTPYERMWERQNAEVQALLQSGQEREKFVRERSRDRYLFVELSRSPEKFITLSKRSYAGQGDEFWSDVDLAILHPEADRFSLQAWRESTVHRREKIGPGVAGTVAPTHDAAPGVLRAFERADVAHLHLVEPESVAEIPAGSMVAAEVVFWAVFEIPKFAEPEDELPFVSGRVGLWGGFECSTVSIRPIEVREGVLKERSLRERLGG